MEKSKKAENGRWMSVPAFGGWEEEEDGLPDYSVDFSNLRNAKKLNKSDYSRVSVGIEGAAALAVSIGDGAREAPAGRQRRQSNHFPRVKKNKKKLNRYFDCFLGS